MKLTHLLSAVCMLGACTGTARATQTWLACRSEPGSSVSAGVATQTLETQWGSSLTNLPFSGTNTYDFYSPPLTQAVALVTSDKAGGVVYMQNTGTTTANDFSVSGQMQFFDYNPSTGTQTLLADTTASPAKDVNHGQTVNWALPNALLVGNVTIPSGHLVHMALTITLVSGNPGRFGSVRYNGPAGPSTAGAFPQNRSQVLDWPFSSLNSGSSNSGTSLPQTILSIVAQLDGSMKLTCGGIWTSNYVLQATTSLDAPAWSALSTNAVGNDGTFTYIDARATNFPHRFYRTVTQ